MAGDQLHDQVESAAVDGGVLALVEDVDHVRVVERRGRLCLLPEARHERRIAAVFGAQDLDRDVAPELPVVRPEDRGHAALAEQLDQAIATGEYLSYLGQVWLVPSHFSLSGAPGDWRAHVVVAQLRSSPDR